MNECKPPEGTEWWSHHWIGKQRGDCEPWLWTDTGIWVRGMQTISPIEMAERGWVYMAPCDPPQTVAALRKRLEEAEGRLPRVVVPLRRRGSDAGQ